MGALIGLAGLAATLFFAFRPRTVEAAVASAVEKVSKAEQRKANAGKRILEQSPFKDFRFARAEHFQIGAERRIFRVARDVAALCRLLDHPA